MLKPNKFSMLKTYTFHSFKSVAQFHYFGILNTVMECLQGFNFPKVLKKIIKVLNNIFWTLKKNIILKKYVFLIC